MSKKRWKTIAEVFLRFDSWVMRYAEDLTIVQNIQVLGKDSVIRDEALRISNIV